MSWKKNFYSATLFVYRPGGEIHPQKYRNVKKILSRKYEDYWKQHFPGAHHVNYYDRETKMFSHRVYL